MKKVMKMYEDDKSEWNEEQSKKLCDFMLFNSVYIVGLTKGNGVRV